jgi:hypothetical protein
MSALLYNHASGIAISLGLAPFIVYRWFALPTRAAQYRVAGGLLLFALVFAQPLAGVVRFVAENAPGGTVASGILLSNEHELPGALAALLPAGGDAARVAARGFKWFKVYGWLLGCLAMLAAVSWRRRLRFEVVFGVGFTLVFVGVLIPYILGRIGTAGLDRSGGLTVLLLGFALPFLLLRQSQKLSPAILALLLAGVGVRALPYLKTLRLPLAVASEGTRVPEGAVEAEVSRDSPPRLGKVIAAPEEIARQEEFTRFLRSALPDPGATYLDFTNQQNYFFIHDRRVPSIYPAHLLMINEAIQKRVIARLQREAPELVWVDPAHDHETSKVSLRAYRVYRWVITAGYTELLRSDGGSFGFLRWRPVSRDRLAAEASALTPFFLHDDLRSLPYAWGRSWESLRRRFRAGPTLTPSRVEAGSAEFRFSPVSGAENDFLLLRMDGATGSGRVCFTDASGEFCSSRFAFAEGPGRITYLVPLGADPRWLHASRIVSLRIQGESLGHPEIRLLHLDL